MIVEICVYLHDFQVLYGLSENPLCSEKKLIIMFCMIEQTIRSSFKRFSSGTFLSRISGLLRDMSLAFFFGSSPEIAAFMVAYRFAHLFRRLFGETAMQSSFIPHYQEKKALKAKYFYRDVLFSLTFLLFLIVVLGEWGLFYLQKETIFLEFSEIFRLTAIMLPSLIFVCLYALNSSFLQCHNTFFLTAAAPCLFNITWIVSSLLIRKNIGIYLSLTVLLASFLQWFFTFQKIPGLISISLKEWFSARLFSKSLKSLMKPFSLGIIGIGAMQINSALDAVFARFSDLSGPSYLWYAIRLQQLPTALFGVSIAGASLPLLTRLLQKGSNEFFIKALQESLSYAIILMVFCTFGIFCLGTLGINLLYGRGSFDQLATIESSYCLWFYGLALLPTACVLLFSSAFYADKSYKIPTLSSLMAVLVNICGNAFFIFIYHLGAYSIALSTSLAAVVNAVYLGYYLNKKCPNFFGKNLWTLFSKALSAALLAMLTTLILGKILFANPSWDLLMGVSVVFTRDIFFQMYQFFSSCLLFMVSFWAFGMLLGISFKSIFASEKTARAEKSL